MYARLTPEGQEMVRTAVGCTDPNHVARIEDRTPPVVVQALRDELIARCPAISRGGANHAAQHHVGDAGMRVDVPIDGTALCARRVSTGVDVHVITGDADRVACGEAPEGRHQCRLKQAVPPSTLVPAQEVRHSTPECIPRPQATYVERTPRTEREVKTPGHVHERVMNRDGRVLFERSEQARGNVDPRAPRRDMPARAGAARGVLERDPSADRGQFGEPLESGSRGGARRELERGGRSFP